MNPGKQKNKNKKRYLRVFCNQYTPDLYMPLLCSRMGRGWGNQLLMGDGDSITHSTYMYTFFCVSVYLVRKELNVIFFNQQPCSYTGMLMHRWVFFPAFLRVISNKYCMHIPSAKKRRLTASLSSGAMLSLKLVLSLEIDGPTMCSSSSNVSPFIRINLCRYLGS